MGRWWYGLLALAFAAAGCAAAAPADVLQSSTGGDSDMAGDLADTSGMCVDGGSCTTSDPGACGMGHVVCSGDVQTCVPDVTTQRCYDGPAGTANVGACKPGTQTCIGGLGSCGGQVLPAAVENCFNDVDDDCDGKVNNGCPDHLTTGTPRALTVRGNANSGAAPFSLRCPAGQFVAKTVVYADDTDVCLGGIDIYCATPTLVRGASSYSVTVTVSPTPLTAHAANINTGENATFNCGAAGFVPAWYVDGESDTSFTNALGSSCATTALTLSATNQLSFTMTKQAGGNYYGYTGLSGATQFEDVCNNGEVLIGWDGKKGNGMDATQAVCAPLQVVYK